jgi:hypothetical protein
MESAELIKLLLAAVVGGILKELVSWLISFSKVSLFGPMWKHSRSVLWHAFGLCLYAFLLIRIGTGDGPATKSDVLLMMGLGLCLLGSAFFLLESIVKWQSVRQAKRVEPTLTSK